MQEEISELNIEKPQKDLIPLGYRKILHKKILPFAIERGLKFYSEKYNKLDYPFAVSKKPVSKIVTYKSPQHGTED